ncbi:restriction endonuclease subunit S [Bacillus norwichensis]|uniref:Restriction endonuclease subunit S n=1 Tax=Bacillus norwichensis TaxID=2762217 RepID=A0ABR8VH91_9BACI|nr:restriction endonuclease subunit S [Bacillus norwichensis]MBD8003771.1 restriction endonuclease subunit S [Bacillus norwichensis]
MRKHKIKFNKVKIKDICSIGDGAHASIKRMKEGILYLTSKNFQSGGLDLTNVDFISERDYEKYFLKKSNSITNVKKNDVVFSIIGSIGMPYIIGENDEFGLSSSVAILRPDLTKVKSEYLYYWILSDVFQGNLRNIKSGVAQGFISLGMINNLPVMLPPLKNQNNITNILSTYDKLIENNNRRIQILEQTAEELYKEWFVRMRFPGYAKTKFEKGIPEGWEVERIGNMASFKKGKNLRITDAIAGGIPVIAGGIEPSCYHNESNTKAPVITVSASGANAGYTRLNHIDVWASDCSYIDIEDTDLIYYLYLLLKVSNKEILNLQLGSAQPHVYARDLNNFKFLKPTENLMIEINNLAKKIFNQIRYLMQQNHNLIKQRDLLLPRLMNGTITVK